MEDFYFVADWGAKHYLKVPNVMISAGSVWQPKTNKFSLSRTHIPDTVEQVFLDSGGYSFFSYYPDYPFTIEEYINLANIIKDQSGITRVVTLDYPCEPDINRSRVSTNEERIQKTVSNAVECIQYDETIPWLPVIQGYTIDEYLYCVDLYKDAGITSDYWAIGSICSRKGFPYKIRRIITTLSEALQSKIHAFGISLKYLYDPQIFNNIYSSDSAAWVWGATKMEQKPQMILDYLEKLDYIFSLHSGQSILMEFKE